MMGEQDRLRPLQMRIARHDRVQVRLRLPDAALPAACAAGRRTRRRACAGTGACRSRPGRCGCGRCAACRRPGRSRRSALSRCSYGCLRRRSRTPARRGGSCRCTFSSPSLIFSTSSAGRMPHLPSIVTCARLPWISSSASSLSNVIDAVYSSTSWSVFFVNRPPHNLLRHRACSSRVNCKDLYGHPHATARLGSR